MRRNPNVEAELYADREWEFTRRYPEPKLVITPVWKGPYLPSRIMNDERQAVCPRCSAGWWSEGLLAFYPDMIEERPREECDLYIHQCEEGD